tara:strand:- start:1020 stop:1520 length:501 start_codon:yes stop_codon:yes gene_type:complete
MSDKLLSNRDNKEKLIIYFVGAAILLFVLVALKEITQSNPYLSAPGWLGILCSIYTLWRFCKKQKENPFASIFNTLKDDYGLDKYVTLQLFSIFYALGQGFGVGAAFGFFVDWMHALLQNSYGKSEFFAGIIGSLLFIILLRLSMEVTSIVYKAAVEFRNYLKSKQ